MQAQGDAMTSETLSATKQAWPALPLAEWKDTRATIHMWTQMDTLHLPGTEVKIWPMPVEMPNPIRPKKAFYHPQLREFLLMHDDVRTSDTPKEDLPAFLQTTHEAGATLGKWDCGALEQSPGAVITPGYAGHNLLRWHS